MITKELVRKLVDVFGIEPSKIDVTKDKFVPVICPLHDDKKRSAGINFYNQVFNCLGCNKSIKLNRLLNDLKIYGSFIDDDNDNKPSKKEPRILPVIPNDVLQKYVKLFIQKRCINKEVYDLFNVDFIMDQADDWYGYALFHNDYFFYGRNFLPEIYGMIKHDIRGKKKITFGLPIDHLTPYIILVEGIYDVLTLTQLGFKNVRAMCQATMVEEQAYDLKRYSNQHIFILGDNDSVGYKGNEANKAILEQFGMLSTILSWNGIFVEKDCNEILQNNKGDNLRHWLLKKTTIKNKKPTVADIFNEKEQLVTFSTGFENINKVFNGGYKPGLHGILAKEGVGKSSFCITIIKNVIEELMQSFDTDKKVLYITTEIPIRQVWSRLASSIQLDYSFGDIESNLNLVKEDTKLKLQKIEKYLDVVNETDFEKVVKMIDNYDFIVIDYFQDLDFPFGSGQEHSVLANAIKKLRNQTMNEDKVLLLISEIPNNVNSLEYKGSGSIKYKVQSTLHLQSYEGKLMITVNKNTRGRSKDGNGWIKLYLVPDLAHSRFIEPKQEILEMIEDELEL